MNPYQLLIDGLFSLPKSELMAKTYFDKSNNCYCAMGAVLRHQGIKDSYLSHLEHDEYPWGWIEQNSGMKRDVGKIVVAINDRFRQGENDEESRKARWRHVLRWAKKNLDRSSVSAVD